MYATNSSPRRRFRAILPVAAGLAYALLPGAVIETEAAPTAGEKRTIAKLKRTAKKLQVQLAAATKPVPAPDSLVEFVTVGNPGNGPDPGNGGDPNVFGAVPYEYRIGKYEVTLAQYTRFLNAVAKSDPYNLYHPEMATDLNVAGIRREGSSGGYRYSVIGSGNRPVTYVNCWDALRFCNWLHNGQPTGGANASTTERGAYTVDGIYVGLELNHLPERNPGARCWLPNVHEWYKAAYHQPAGSGGDVDSYWNTPFGFNYDPDTDIRFQVRDKLNIWLGYTLGYYVTQSPIYELTQNYLTEAGHFANFPSYYGTYDQGGNVGEWCTPVVDLKVEYDVIQGMGGSWGGSGYFTPGGFGGGVDSGPNSEGFIYGFRVAAPAE